MPGSNEYRSCCTSFSSDKTAFVPWHNNLCSEYQCPSWINLTERFYARHSWVLYWSASRRELGAEIIDGGHFKIKRRVSHPLTASHYPSFSSQLSVFDTRNIVQSMSTTKSLKTTAERCSPGPDIFTGRSRQPLWRLGFWGFNL